MGGEWGTHTLGTSSSMGSLAWPPRDPDPLPRAGIRLQEFIPDKNNLEVFPNFQSLGKEGYCFLETHTHSQLTPLLRSYNWGWYCQKAGEGLPVILVSSEETPSPGPG